MPTVKETDERFTPAWFVDIVRRFAGGPIGLDPCAAPGIDLALVNWQLRRDGNSLLRSWSGYGLVFVNEPYSQGNLAAWVEKCAYEAFNHRVEIVNLVPASTSAQWWQKHVPYTDATCLIEQRIRFGNAKPGSPWFGSAALYWGPRRRRFRRIFGELGMVI